MKPRSRRSRSWWKYWRKLPSHIQEEAFEAFRIFSRDPHNPTLKSKEYIVGRDRIYRVQVTYSYRAVAVLTEETYVWVYIGTHAEYETFLGLNR
ncbi:hypothetical protein BH11ARM2_BH11ARM2_38140 [soil metagenome]